MRARLDRSAEPDRIFQVTLEMAGAAGLVGRRRVVDSTPLSDWSPNGASGPPARLASPHGHAVPAGQVGRPGPVASGADDLHPNGTDTIDLVHRLRVTALTWEARLASQAAARTWRSSSPTYGGAQPVSTG